MQKADELPVPYARFVTSYGTYGKCDYCEHAVDSTAEIRGKRCCTVCKDQKFAKSTGKFQETDATFKCPAEKCEADKLSYHEFYVGSCCQAALNRNITAEREEECLLMQKIYQQSRRDEDSSFSAACEASMALYDAERDVNHAERELEYAKEKLTRAKENKDRADQKSKKYRKWHKKVTKRLFIAAKTVKECDSSDSEDDVIVVGEKKAKRDDVNEKNECRVCLERYDDERPSAIIIPCAHMFCFKCIKSLPEKKCPNCRAEFTDNNVYKTH